MFKIGEFARMSGVSAKRLRHYDEVGLFRPAWVDPGSGYRFYSPTQLPELYRIVTLRELGIPLADVAGLVRDGADLAAALTRRRADLVDEREALDRRLRALDIRVDLDAASAHMDVVVRRLERELVAGCRVVLGPGDDLEPVFNELEAHVRDTGCRAARPPATLIHREDHSGRRDVEAVVPLDQPIPSTGRVACRWLPAGRAAAVIHRGAYEGLPRHRTGLDEWVARAGLQPNGPLRIVYLQFGADADLRVPGHFLAGSPTDFVTELQQPVAG